MGHLKTNPIDTSNSQPEKDSRSAYEEEVEFDGLKT